MTALCRRCGWREADSEGVCGLCADRRDCEHDVTASDGHAPQPAPKGDYPEPPETP